MRKQNRTIPNVKKLTKYKKKSNIMRVYRRSHFILLALYAYIYMYIYAYIYAYIYTRIYICIRPTQWIMYVPSQVNTSQKCILLIVQYKYIKSCSGGFYSPESDPPHEIMRYWITQPSCIFDFHLTESVRWKWFVLAVYQFWKGISAGPALKYFTWFIGAGGYI